MHELLRSSVKKKYTCSVQAWKYLSLKKHTGISEEISMLLKSIQIQITSKIPHGISLKNIHASQKHTIHTTSKRIHGILQKISMPLQRIQNILLRRDFMEYYIKYPCLSKGYKTYYFEETSWNITKNIYASQKETNAC